MYAAGSEKEKRAGGSLHGDTIAQLFLFCNGAVSGWKGGSCFGLRPPSAESLAWPAPLSRPLHPPTFLETGGLPLYRRRGLRPLHPAWGRDERGLTARRPAIPPALPGDVVRDRGTRCSPGGGCAPAPGVGEGWEIPNQRRGTLPSRTRVRGRDGRFRRGARFLTIAARRASEPAPDGVITWFESRQVGRT